MPLVDKYGQQISSQMYKKDRLPTTQLGEKFGQWAGRQVIWEALPGGGLVQFDLNKLTLQDYRTMMQHYQVNSSLSVLSFMQHQSNWKIECDNKKVKDFVTEQIDVIWTQLNRALSQANWAGYGPNVLQWENDVDGKQVVLGKIKDLAPEECNVNWKEVEGYAPPEYKVKPKLRIFDGIHQLGTGWPIPVENSFWYPLLMENGNYYGRKILKAAYTSYFFSMLMHLFSNRYMERFGEPVPVGRAPMDDTVSVYDPVTREQVETPANVFMLDQLMNLRNRAAVVLPADRGEDVNGRGYFDYDLQYLESQMRGADFERYMQRLDEEISLAIFTPVLLMRTADVGSYNLGVGHMQMYLWELNALNADRATYIDKYIIRPLVNYNFAGGDKIECRIKFNKLDNANANLLQVLLQALVGQDRIKFNLEQLGEMAGLEISEIKQLTAPPPEPGQNPPSDNPNDPGRPGANDNPPGDTKAPAAKARMQDIRTQIMQRVTGQVDNAFFNGRFDSNLKLNMGFKHRMGQVLAEAGFNNPGMRVDNLYSVMDAWSAESISLGTKYYHTVKEFTEAFDKVLEYEIVRATGGSV